MQRRVKRKDTAAELVQEFCHDDMKLRPWTAGTAWTCDWPASNVHILALDAIDAGNETAEVLKDLSAVGFQTSMHRL